MTHEDIAYDRRVRLIEYAAKTGNVSEACRVFGVSRKSHLRVGQRREVRIVGIVAPASAPAASAERDEL